VAIISNATTIADAGAFSVSLGSKVHIKTLTASSSATLSFVHGSNGVVFDNTYPIYKFVYTSIHPETQSNFSFQVDTGTNTNYNQAITSTSFYAEHSESDNTALSYFASTDQAQGTGFQMISHNPGVDNDSNCSGELTIFNPSSSTFVKHFIGDSNCTNGSATSHRNFVAGYVNTTTALTRVQFKFSSDNIDAGKIKLYGIKDS
jgi:hypothetical protein